MNDETLLLIHRVLCFNRLIALFSLPTALHVTLDECQSDIVSEAMKIKSITLNDDQFANINS